MANAVEIRDLKKSYGRRRILDIKEADFGAGEIVGLVGPNGTGKTTLLECVNGLARPDSGEVKIFGEPLSASSRRRTTMVFQTPYLFDTTVEKNVAYGLRFRKGTEPGAVRKALETVGLEGFETRRAKSLSGGEGKRVSIARALVLKPEALLLDEPTANIDHENTTVIESVIKSLSLKQGTTIIIATHDREQAARLSDRVFMLSDGMLAPYHPDNHYRAELVFEDDEHVLLFGNQLRAVASTSVSPGVVSCVIPPEDIVVSSAPVDTSARNCWSGSVTAVALDGERIRITVDVGIPVVATVTKVSFEKLRPTIGSGLCLSFKASSIIVF